MFDVCLAGKSGFNVRGSSESANDPKETFFRQITWTAEVDHSRRQNGVNIA